MEILLKYWQICHFLNHTLIQILFFHSLEISVGQQQGFITS